MKSLWCMAYKCPATTDEYDTIEEAVAEARENRWLVVKSDTEEGVYITWCKVHRVLVPTWHDTIRVGDIDKYL